MIKKFIPLAFWLSIFAFLCLGIDSIILTYPDEGRNAFATLQMIKTNQYIVPFYNGEIRYDKPPLLYYLGSIIYNIFKLLNYENIEVAFRLVSVISVFFSSIIVFHLSKYFITNEIYRYFAVVIYVSFINIFVESKAFVPEPLLSLFINLSIFSFYKLFKENPDSKIWNHVFWISIGLGILSKGIVAIIVTFLVILSFLIIQGELKFIKNLFKNLVSVIIGLTIGFSWFIAVGIETKGEFLYQFFWIHNFGRFTGSSNMHLNPPYFYILVLLTNIIPIIETCCITIYYIIKKLKDKETIRKLGFLFTYFIVIVIFYSLSKGKVHHYILPSLVPLSIIISYATQESKKNIFVYLPSLIIPLTLIFINLNTEYLILKEIFIFFFIFFTIIYIILPQQNIPIITTVKAFLFYLIIILNINKIFPNQEKILEIIKNKTIITLGDISTISFYNLYLNNNPKTEDIFYILEQNKMTSDIIKEINKNKEVLIFTKEKYKNRIIEELYKEKSLNIEIKEIKKVIVAQSKIDMIIIKNKLK